MQLSNFGIRNLKEKYGLTAFIETGSEHGVGIETALRSGFDKIRSCEINKDNYDRCRDMFNNNYSVRLWHGNSIDTLPDMLEKTGSDRCLFWLDSHLPKEQTSDNVLPLREELEIITAQKNIEHDVIIIDDLRLFDPEQFDFDLNHYLKVKVRKLLTKQEIVDFFPDHNCSEIVKKEGALIFWPGLRWEWGTNE